MLGHAAARAPQFGPQHAPLRHFKVAAQHAVELGIDLFHRDGRQKSQPAQVHREQRNVLPDGRARRRQQRAVAAQDHQKLRPRGNLLNAQPFVRGDFAYVGEVVTNLEGFESVTAQAAVTTQDAYETGDLRVGLEGDRWSGSLFVRNVWDERAVTFRSNRWAVPRLSIIQPRTYGLQFRYEF